MNYLKKKNLITTFNKLHYPRGTELLFIDEYLYNLYQKSEIQNYKCSYINSLKSINKITHSNNNIIKKKLLIYRKEFSYLLNSYHKENYKVNYWGLIIDQFLLNVIGSIVIEIKLFQKVRKEHFNIIN